MTSPAQDTDTLTPPHTLTISFQNEMMRFLPICQLRCEFNIYIFMDLKMQVGTNCFTDSSGSSININSINGMNKVNSLCLTGAVCSLPRRNSDSDLSIYEVMTHTQKYLFSRNLINKLFSEENDAPEHWLKPERWQGPPHVNSHETVCPFRSVGLFSFLSRENKVL